MGTEKSDGREIGGLIFMKTLPEYAEPSNVPAPRLLCKAIPLLEEDFSSGEVGRFLLTLGTQDGFSELESDDVKAVVAHGFGYESWDAMRLLVTDAMAESADMPSRDFRVMDVVAWRMFLSGRVGLREACTAVTAAWEANLLTIRKLYGDFGQLEIDDVDEYQSVDFGLPMVRQVEISDEDWQPWPEVQLTQDGRLQVKWAAELAHIAASYCWTPESGISLENLVKEIARGGVMDIETAIQQSWMFTEAWPTGLDPTQFLDAAGKLVGYGWRWTELGLLHTKVFGSTEALRKSAAALWLQKPTDHLALEEVPAQLVEVDFKNPWDTRDFARGRSEELKAEMAFSAGHHDNTRMDLHKTDGSSLRLGHEVLLGGEVWTRPDVDATTPNVDGVLGLRLPTMKEVKRAGCEHDWLLKKVPFAFSMPTYWTICRLAMAAQDLSDKEEEWISNDSAAEQEISALLRKSVVGATPGIAASSAAFMEETLGALIMQTDVRQGGDTMADVYPELLGLSAKVRGEYALAYYGKDGLRHERKHLKRDLSFMAYAVLRNLGVDVRPHAFYGNPLVLHRIVRLDCKAVPWTDETSRRRSADGAHLINRAFRWLEAVTSDLDDSLGGPSRLSVVLDR